MTEFNLDDAYKLKWFGTYWVEIDTDDTEKIREFHRQIKKLTRFRFIKFIIVPKYAVEIKKIERLEHVRV